MESDGVRRGPTEESDGVRRRGPMEGSDGGVRQSPTEGSDGVRQWSLMRESNRGVQ